MLHIEGLAQVVCNSDNYNDVSDAGEAEDGEEEEEKENTVMAVSSLYVDPLS